MALTEGPIEERPREKLLSFGAASLSDAELLAIFLRTGTRMKPVMALARDLLNEFHGVRGLLEADKQTLIGAYGIGEAKFAQLHAALELTERYLQAGFERGDANHRPRNDASILKK